MSIVLRPNVMALVFPLLVCGITVAADVGVSESFKGPTGLQLYSLRDMQKSQGVAATLDTAKAFGFKYVEVADLGDCRRRSSSRNSTSAGWYRSAAISPTVGSAMTSRASPGRPRPWECPTSVVRGLTHGPLRREAVPRGGGGVQPGGRGLAKHGIKLYYHNHGCEFEPMARERCSTCWWPRPIRKPSSSRWT